MLLPSTSLFNSLPYAVMLQFSEVEVEVALKHTFQTTKSAFCCTGCVPLSRCDVNRPVDFLLRNCSSEFISSGNRRTSRPSTTHGFGRSMGFICIGSSCKIWLSDSQHLHNRLIVYAARWRFSGTFILFVLCPQVIVVGSNQHHILLGSRDNRK
jgi:hypothetical protein